MDKKITTNGLDPRALAHLWSIGLDSDQSPSPDPNQTRVELLLDRLAQQIPLEQNLAPMLPKVLAQFCMDMKPFASNSIQVLLSRPNTDLTTLQRLKQYCKGLATGMLSEADRDVVVVLYYAAIAGALVYHEQRITTFSYKHLALSYRSLLKHTWLTSQIRYLFERAHAFCGDNLSPPESLE